MGALGCAQALPQVGVQIHAVGGLIELGDRQAVHRGVPFELGFNALFFHVVSVHPGEKGGLGTCGSHRPPPLQT